nr:uncharacterized protein LOC106026257 [Cavia porcellus]
MLSKRHGAAHAQKGPVPATRWWRKKERNHLRVTSGKAAFCGEAVALHGAPQFSQTQGLDSYSPLFSSEAGARLLSAHTRLARAAAAAAAVIPSILNLTSSHTRDEVIAGSARHVRGARIGRQAPGGGTREARGAGAGRAGQGGAGSVCAARGSLRSLRRPRLESSRSEKRRPRRRPAGWGLVGPCTVAAEAIVTAFLASGSRGRWNQLALQLGIALCWPPVACGHCSRVVCPGLPRVDLTSSIVTSSSSPATCPLSRRGHGWTVPS